MTTETKPAPRRGRRMARVSWFDALRTPRECEVRYRLGDGEARKAAKAGAVKHAERPGRGGHICFLIDPHAAEAMWGAR